MVDDEQRQSRPFQRLSLVLGDPGVVATLTLDRPAARNAIDRQMAAELAAVLADLAARPGVRALVVTGAGGHAFSAGADLRERVALTPAERSGHTAAIEAAAEALAALPVPTIAAVRGFALGGGAELALACDLRVAATDAVFGFPEVRVGVFPGAGGVVRLPRLIGPGAARDLLFTGRRVGAQEAHRLGLVDRLVPPDDLLSAATALANEISGNAPLAVRAVKRALIDSAALPESEARLVVNRLRAPLDATADYDEGLAAFAERRSPWFRGA